MKPEDLSPIQGSNSATPPQIPIPPPMPLWTPPVPEEAAKSASGLTEHVEHACERQVGGTHYQDMAIQPWEALDAWQSWGAFAGYLQGTAVAYLARAGKKGPEREDIQKAIHVLQRLDEHLAER